LARELISCGCAEGKVARAVLSCADVFGISIGGAKFMSRRTVGRARDEGGKYAEIQLGREIMDCQGFIESSDGTTHRGIIVESRHVSFLAPTYAPGIDDALDHTAERQFEGTQEAVARIADVYSRSPLAARDQRTMEIDDYYRKKDGELKDHAADGKKECQISAAYKQDVVMRDLGQAVLDDIENPALARILKTLPMISDQDLAEAGKISESEFGDERAKLTILCLRCNIVGEQFDMLPPAQQKRLTLHLFAGCCSHKDLNVVRKGYAFVEALYTSNSSIPRPVVLANKANDRILTVAAQSGESDSASAQAAVEASSRGAIKFLQLVRSLLRHQDGKRGYQDKCVHFMKERKLEMYDLDAAGKFPDVSNNRFGAYSYAAAEVVCFEGLIRELVQEIVDGKTQSGQKNHVEKNILKGLDCRATFTELVALALDGVAVSWPYMALVHGKKDKPVNLLSLTDLHRKLPVFCNFIADHPEILLDPSTPPDKLTIDGLPFRDDLLIPSIMLLRSELPDLPAMISAMFRDAAEGWVHFTPEFHVGGTFDQLTDEERARIHIPADNDHNEGMLGSYRVHMRYHPNATPNSFSNQTRAERNNTEMFVEKHGNSAELARFVMCEVRREGASGCAAKFRREFLALQREKARKALRRRLESAEKKKLAHERLMAIQVELNTDEIRKMTSPQLKAQLEAYRAQLQDQVLLEKKWKDMTTVEVRRGLVLAARER
ncbi:hypothetical protein C8R45DRAFT_1177843, partial [Mycena sanguinolenta]